MTTQLDRDDDQIDGVDGAGLSGSGEWLAICRYDRLQPERGVAALVGDDQVAVFRTFDGMLHAISNQDPFSGQFVLSRGIVGTHGDVPTVASPLFKQAFDLTTGACISDPSVRVEVFGIRRRDDMIDVRVRPPQSP